MTSAGMTIGIIVIIAVITFTISAIAIDALHILDKFMVQPT